MARPHVDSTIPFAASESRGAARARAAYVRVALVWFAGRGYADVTHGSRSREPFLDPAVPPRSSSEPQQPAPESPPATSGPRPPDAPSLRPIGALPTRAAPASRWLARGRRGR